MSDAGGDEPNFAPGDHANAHGERVFGGKSVPQGARSATQDFTENGHQKEQDKEHEVPAQLASVDRETDGDKEERPKEGIGHGSQVGNDFLMGWSCGHEEPGEVSAGDGSHSPEGLGEKREGKTNN